MTDPTASACDFSGVLAAYPGENIGQVNYTPGGAPGTVYIQEADDLPMRGDIRIVNHPNAGEFGGWSQGAFVQYPSIRYSKDPARGDMRVLLEGYARFSLTRDASIGDLIVTGSKPKIFLNGHKLTIHARRHPLSATIDYGTDGAGNPGEIIWGSGMKLMLK